MSELIVNSDNRATIRWKLLTGASAMALAACMSSANPAHAEDSARPVVWLEADTQFALQSDNRESFLPPFLNASPFSIALPAIQKKPPSVWDEDAKISFQPSGSDWVMSLGVRYGKSNRQRAGYQYVSHITSFYSRFVNAYQGVQAHSDEKHMLLDFKAGKDFGLGMFGHEGSSTVSVGVRYAQFDSRNSDSVASRPNYAKSNYDVFYESFEGKRSFRGVGPSLSWDGSANIAGNLSDGSLALDWGLNGSLLFGRQKADLHHQKTELYQPGNGRKRHPAARVLVYHTSTSPVRSKSVTVPNLGAYAALSYRLANAKLALGYRYDRFFGAIDGGIDTAKKEDRAFYGPYASISIGIGD